MSVAAGEQPNSMPHPDSFIRRIKRQVRRLNLRQGQEHQDQERNRHYTFQDEEIPVDDDRFRRSMAPSPVERIDKYIEDVEESPREFQEPWVESLHMGLSSPLPLRPIEHGDDNARGTVQSPRPSPYRTTVEDDVEGTGGALGSNAFTPPTMEESAPLIQPFTREEQELRAGRSAMHGEAIRRLEQPQSERPDEGWYEPEEQEPVRDHPPGNERHGPVHEDQDRFERYEYTEAEREEYRRQLFMEGEERKRQAIERKKEEDQEHEKERKRQAIERKEEEYQRSEARRNKQHERELKMQEEVRKQIERNAAQEKMLERQYIDQEGFAAEVPVSHTGYHDDLPDGFEEPNQGPVLIKRTPWREIRRARSQPMQSEYTLYEEEHIDGTRGHQVKIVGIPRRQEDLEHRQHQIQLDENVVFNDDIPDDEYPPEFIQNQNQFPGHLAEGFERLQDPRVNMVKESRDRRRFERRPQRQAHLNEHAMFNDEIPDGAYPPELIQNQLQNQHQHQLPRHLAEGFETLQDPRVNMAKEPRGRRRCFERRPQRQARFGDNINLDDDVPECAPPRKRTHTRRGPKMPKTPFAGESERPVKFEFRLDMGSMPDFAPILAAGFALGMVIQRFW